MPWLQVGIVDPSSRQALVPVLQDGVPTPATVDVPAIELRVIPERGASATATLGWDIWNLVAPAERLKRGYGRYAEALKQVEDPSKA